MAIRTQIIDGPALSTQTARRPVKRATRRAGTRITDTNGQKAFRITLNAPLRKHLVIVLIALAGTLGIQAANPSDNHAGPEIIRGGDGQLMASVIVGPTNSEVQRVAQASAKEPVVIRGPGMERSPSPTSLPTSTIEERLNRVERAMESERREVNCVMWITSVAVVSICVLGLGLLASRYKS